MPTVSYALMGAQGVTMSVPVTTQYNELNESYWKKSNCSLGDHIPNVPGRSHSAAAIHFDDHGQDQKDKEMTKSRHRRHSLSPNFVVNENNRLVSVYSSTTFVLYISGALQFILQITLTSKVN